MTSAASLTHPTHIAERALVVRRSRFEQSRCGQGTRVRADRASVPRMKSILGQSPQPNQAVGFARWRPVAKSPFSRRGAHTLIAVALLASTLLTGCSSTPELTPTSTPIVGSQLGDVDVRQSDEAIFQQSKAVVLKYVEAVTTVSNAGGMNVEVFKQIVADDQYIQEMESAIFYAENGYHTVGSMNAYDFVRGMVVQSGDYLSASVTFCSDASGVRFLDSLGNDVTPATRMDFQKLTAIVQFEEGQPLIYSIDPGETPESCG